MGRCHVALATVLLILASVGAQEAEVQKSVEERLVETQSTLQAWIDAYNSLKATSDSTVARLTSELEQMRDDAASLKLALEAQSSATTEAQAAVLSCSSAKSAALEEAAAAAAEAKAAAAADAAAAAAAAASAATASCKAAPPPSSECFSVNTSCLVQQASASSKELFEELKAGNVTRLKTLAVEGATASGKALVAAAVWAQVQLDAFVAAHPEIKEYLKLPLAWLEAAKKQFAAVEKEVHTVIKQQVTSTKGLEQLNDPVTLQLLTYTAVGLPVVLLLLLPLALLCCRRSAPRRPPPPAPTGKGKKAAKPVKA